MTRLWFGFCGNVESLKEYQEEQMKKNMQAQSRFAHSIRARTGRRWRGQQYGVYWPKTDLKIMK